jgi:hypothetical protein
MANKYFRYFYSSDEQADYFRQWQQLSTSNFSSYTPDQFKMYEELSLENSHIDYIQFNHYMDEGCNCKACNIKRYYVANKIISGSPLTPLDRIKHDEAKTQMFVKRVIRANKINEVIKSIPLSQQKKGKNFKQDMNSIVSGKTRY